MVIPRVLTGLLLASTAFGWSARGHRIVAMIAEKHLSSNAALHVRELLGPDSMASVSAWSDKVRGNRRYGSSCHFVNIPVEASNPDPDRFCPADGCIFSKLDEFAAMLRTTSGKSPERVDALKFVIHFVADLHQPLHVGNQGDRGGNDRQVRFFGKPTNLHAVWDRELLQRVCGNERKCVQRLEGTAQARWSGGSTHEWTLESYSVARNVAYVNLSANLGDAYLAQCAPSVLVQLEKAGLRLAALLDEMWK